LELVKKHGDVLQFASPRLREDKDIVFESVNAWGDAFQFASDNLKDDKEFFLQLPNKAKFVAKEFLSERLKVDKDIQLNLKAIRHSY